MRRAGLLPADNMNKKSLWPILLVMVAFLAVTGLATMANTSTPPVHAANTTLTVYGAGTHSSSRGAALPPCSSDGWQAAAPLPDSVTRYGSVQDGDNFYVITGYSPTTPNAVRRYNVTTNTWTQLAPIPRATSLGNAALYNGKIYVVGGWGDGHSVIGNDFLQVYDIATNSWAIAPLPFGMIGPAVGAYNGKIFVAGGYATFQSWHQATTLAVYDIASSTWVTTANSLPAPYGVGGFVQNGQYLYAVGGLGDLEAMGPGKAGNLLDVLASKSLDAAPAANPPNGTSTMRLDMATGTWSNGPEWTPARADIGLALANKKLYAIGGSTNDGTSRHLSTEVDSLDLSAWQDGVWEVTNLNLPSPRYGNSGSFFTTSRTGGEIWSVGGESDVYDFRENLYLSLSPCPNGTNTPTSTPTPCAQCVTVTNTPGTTQTSIPTSTSTPTLTRTPSATSTPGCGPAWRQVTSANIDSQNDLLGVAAISANDVWAVGFYRNATSGLYQPLLEHWDGAAWAISQHPVQGAGLLESVTAISSNDVWAVGETDDSGSGSAITLHWNGSQWALVPTPGLSPTGIRLLGVDAVSSTDVWAVGSTTSFGPTFHPLTLHWNGTQWSVVPCPSNSRSTTLNAVAAVSSDNVWAVGYLSDSYGMMPVTLRWNGIEWSAILSPYLPSGGLLGVTALSQGDVWASGFVGDSTGHQQAVTEHWNGASWSVVELPAPTQTFSSYLESITALSQNDVWAAGWYSSSGGNQQLIAHWNGSSWTLFDNVAQGLGGGGFNAVTTTAPGHVWSVGFMGGTGGSLTMRYSDSCAPLGMLLGHVTWQGRPAQPAGLQQLPVTLTLKLGTNEVNYPAQTTDVSGFFTVSVTGLPAGTYSWRAKGPQYLANTGVVSLGGGPIPPTEIGLMRAGDANNDNRVNAIDFNILKNTFAKSVGDPGYDPRADFTGDQLVNIADLNLLKSNLGLAGGPPLLPR